MATLMTFKSASKQSNRCDAKCYDAHENKCVCCCQGRNHGVGFARAFKNTTEHFEEIVKEAKNIKNPKLRITNIKQNKKFIRYFKEIKRQLTLFGEEDEKQILERIKNIRP